MSDTKIHTLPVITQDTDLSLNECCAECKMDTFPHICTSCNLESDNV